MTVQELGRSVRFRRQQMGVSQESFAAKAGISLRKLSDIECGNGNPTFDTMDSIAAAFGIQIEELICADVEVDLLPGTTSPASSRCWTACRRHSRSFSCPPRRAFSSSGPSGAGRDTAPSYNKRGFYLGYGRGERRAAPLF